MAVSNARNGLKDQFKSFRNSKPSHALTSEDLRECNTTFALNQVKNAIVGKNIRLSFFSSLIVELVELYCKILVRNILFLLM